MSDQTNLDRSRLFAGLAPEETRVVIAACKEQLLVAGEDLFLERDEGDALFLVQSGRVEIFKRIRGDLDRMLASIGPGEVLGEVSFIDGSRRSAGARTLEASEFLVLTRARFQQVEREHPAIAAAFFRNLAAVLSSRLRTTNELYRESVIFGLEATGASALNLKALSDELVEVTLHLTGGGAVTGRVLQMDHHAAGYTLVVKDTTGRMMIVPYHALQRIEIA